MYFLSFMFYSTLITSFHKRPLVKFNQKPFFLCMSNKKCQHKIKTLFVNDSARGSIVLPDSHKLDVRPRELNEFESIVNITDSMFPKTNSEDELLKIHKRVSQLLEEEIKPFCKSKKNKNEKVKLKTTFPEYKPRGPNQEKYLSSLEDPNTDIVLGVGPAGSGKTLFACYVAIQELIKGNIKKIIMTRPLVSVDKEDIGYLPGNLVSKMDPWTRPIFDILLDFFSQREIDSMIQAGTIEISPLAYMRGRTFKNAFIIADEMQNSSPNQMLMMTTRLGEGTKMVITGDLKQGDRQDDNGLDDIIKKIKTFNNNITHNTTNDSAISEAKGSIVLPETNKIQLIELTATDIERSPVVKKILDMYEPKPLPRPIKRPQPPPNDCAMIPSSVIKDPITTTNKDIPDNFWYM